MQKNIFRSFPRTFWIANTIELVERWAWYGLFMLFANYLTGSADEGGLEFSNTQKGMIMGLGTAILYFLPVFTGALADKFGYRRMLIIAFTIYTTAFLVFPYFNSFGGVFAAYIFLAIGAALFKPIISATIAKTTHEGNSSVGFGIFYMMVNVGAFFGPMTTLFFKGASYDVVFHLSAAMIALNFIMLIFYKEPEREQSKEALGEVFSRIFKNIGEVFMNLKFVLFLVIVAGFWTMYNQLFFTLPVFIKQWVDTSNLYHFFALNMPFFSDNYGEGGMMDAEFITNFDALYIIVFQVFVSMLVQKWKPLSSMTTGFVINSIGMALTLYTQNVFFLLLSMLIFSIGEMMGSPKITEYIGLIAPKDKKALYMGFSFIPVFIGNFFAGIVAGPVYQALSDKHQLTLQLINDKKLSVSLQGNHNEIFEHTAAAMHMSTQQLTDYLWEHSHPSRIWIIIFAIGILSAFFLNMYNRKVIKKN